MFGILNIINLNAVWEGNWEAILYFFCGSGDISLFYNHPKYPLTNSWFLLISWTGAGWCANAIVVWNFNSRDSISWLYSCDKSSYIRSVHSTECPEQNVNNQSLAQVSHLYVSFVSKVIRSWLRLTETDQHFVNTRG